MKIVECLAANKHNISGYFVGICLPSGVFFCRGSVCMFSTCLDPWRSLVVSGMKRNVYSDIRPSSTRVCSIRAEGHMTGTVEQQLIYTNEKNNNVITALINYLLQVSV